MHLARAILAGALVFATCLLVGHSTAATSVRTSTAAPVPSTTTTAVPATTTSTTSPPIVHASRGSRVHEVGNSLLDDATRARVIAAICSHGWDCGLMVRVAGCESGLRPWARNGRHVGIFQIAGATSGLIEEHVDLAFSMWQTHGMGPWLASRNCWS